MELPELSEGQRVRLLRNVERYPHFVAPEGASGTVTTLEEGVIGVRLDDDLEGAEEWDNEVRWSEGLFAKDDFREVFLEDVELIAEED